MRLSPAGLIVMLALFLVPAFPYGLQYAPGSKKPLRWKSGPIALKVSESLLVKDAVRGNADAIAVLKRAAAVWTSAGAPEFEIGTSNLESVSPAGRSGDGLSLITIASTPENLLLFAGGTIPKPAVTRLFYDRNGTITEADIVLNPYFAHSANGAPGSFDLESTLVHEIGHLLGLGHSSLPGASMFEFNGRNGLYGLPFSMFRSLSADDKAGIRTLYGASPDLTDCCAVFEGTVPANGVEKGPFLVWGESAESGSVEGAVASKESGAFRLSGLGFVSLRVYAKDERTGRIFDIGTYDPDGQLSAPSADDEESSRTGLSILGAGVNGELSGLAVPLTNGNTYRLYAAVTGFPDSTSFQISSPAIEIDDGSYEVFDYGDGVTVVSFLLSVGKRVPAGLYSLRIVSGKKVVDSLPGVISIGMETNRFVYHEAADARDSKPEN